MSYQGNDPNQQNQYPGYGSYNPSQPPPQPTDPYSGQQYGQQGPQGGYQQGPQSGYQQPNYGQGQQQPPYGQAQYSQPGATSMGMSQNTAAGLSYVFVWVSGLIIFLMEKQNRFVRFHAMQSIIFFGGYTVLTIVLDILANLPVLGFLFAILSPIAGIIAFVGWIVLMVNGFQGKYFKLPVIGDYAERYANQGTM